MPMKKMGKKTKVSYGGKTKTVTGKTAAMKAKKSMLKSGKRKK